MAQRKRAAAAVLALLNSQNAKSRKVWVRDLIERRRKFGAFHSLLRELTIEDPQQYRNFVRMSKSDLEELLAMIGPSITRQDTHLRDAISPAERLVVTLRFLATGDSYASLQYLFRIPKNTLSTIIPEVCHGIYEKLKEQFLQMPSSPEEWEEIASGFEKKWNFPQCLGSLDGKHVVMQASPNSGSYYFNYKNTHSIVLMALVNANYEIIYLNVGCNGRVSDGGVFGQCSLSTDLETNTLNMPQVKPLPGREKPVPYVVVADDAFAMKKYLIKPYPSRDQPGPNLVFNYRLSRARRTVENCFGIMASKFRVLRKPILLNPDTTEKFLSAVCALHNLSKISSILGENLPCTIFHAVKWTLRTNQHMKYALESGEMRECHLTACCHLTVEPIGTILVRPKKFAMSIVNTSYRLKEKYHGSTDSFSFPLS